MLQLGSIDFDCSSAATAFTDFLDGKGSVVLGTVGIQSEPVISSKVEGDSGSEVDVAAVGNLHKITRSSNCSSAEFSAPAFLMEEFDIHIGCAELISGLEGNDKLTLLNLCKAETVVC